MELAKVKEDVVKKTSGEYIEPIQVKWEDEGEEKAIINTIQPTTGSKKTSVEMVEDESGFTPTSITMFFSPVMEIKKIMRNSIACRLVTPYLIRY